VVAVLRSVRVGVVLQVDQAGGAQDVGEQNNFVFGWSGGLAQGD
jgi:hypothetical protein